MQEDLEGTIIFQKMLSLGATLILYILIGGGHNLILCNIVLGYSHHLLGAYYRVSSPAFQWRNFLQLMAIGALIAALFYRPNDIDFRLNIFLFITTLYTIYHAVMDDQYTLNFFQGNYGITQKLYTLALILILIAQQIAWQFAHPSSLLCAHLCAGLAVILGLAALTQARRFQPKDIYMMMLLIGLVALYLSGRKPMASHVILPSLIGIYHYLLFYMHYFTKLTSKSTATKIYVWQCVAVNGVMLSLFTLWVFNPASALQYFFSYNLFMLVTLLHFISSHRRGEWFGNTKSHF
jgi:hypothetical protein